MRGPVASWHAGKRWPLITVGVVAALVVVLGVCEAIGWPFLVSPVQSWLARTLDRRVVLERGADDAGVRIRLLGSVRVRAPSIEIGAPAWSSAPHLLLAHDAYLKLGYLDLWRAWHGQPLHIAVLEAGDLDAALEREAGGRASWEFGAKAKDETSGETPLPSFGSLQVGAGHVVYRDALMPAHVDARFALRDGSDTAAAAASAPMATAASAGASDAGVFIRAGERAASAAAAASAPPVSLAPGESGLALKATGAYRKFPVRIDLRTSGVLGLFSDGKEANTQPVRLLASIGSADLSFNGSTTDPLHFAGLKGAFSLAGPSLAAVGDPLGITLPTTPAFKTHGTLVKEGKLWKAVFEAAQIGASHLDGAFTYDTRSAVPLLSGRLGGSKLQLADLGPAVGAPAPGAAEKTKGGGRVIPDRDFDLPSLRAMDANVMIDIARLDTGADVLADLRPARVHLLLAGGVLTLSDLEAQTAKGRLVGYLQLDGRGAQARWTADLRLLGVDLARFLTIERAAGKPPYLAGKLDAQVKVAGAGRSTAEILGSLAGGIRMHMRDASISHLAVEAVGIDVAQALGMLVKGDDALAIQCNVADLGVEKGVVRPNVFVVNTSDSTIWLDGTASLKSEALDVRAVVSPKDFSPLTLRTPVHVRGTFGDPQVSLELGKLAGKAGAAALLALLNPLAAVIPFIDPGAGDEAKKAGSECRDLARSRGRISAAVRTPGNVKVPAGSR